MIVVLFNIYSACLYNFAKSITDSTRDYPGKSKFLRWVGTWKDVGICTYFRDVWHWAEWIKEFALWGCVFVNACEPIRTERELIIRGASIIFSFWLGGRLFYYLYHWGWRD